MGSKINTVLAGQLEEKDHLEDLGIDKSTVLKWIFRNGMVGGGVCMDWIHLAYVGEQWHVL
jgi:hypothetical protein